MNAKRIAYLIVGFVFAALLIAVVNVFSSETIRACRDHANDTILYTNKDVKECEAVKLPELSVVPSRHDYLALNPTAAKTARNFDPSINDKVCMLYDEWMTLQQRTLGGFAHNSVQDTQRRLVLVQLFGAGVMPMNCNK